MEKGIICKDKNIEKYALDNYGRLSGMTTIGVIITALTEYASQRDTEPKEEGKGVEETDLIQYVTNLLYDALQRNYIFWSMYYWKHIRGGHFYFQIPITQ